MLYYLGNTVTVGIKEYSHCLSTLGIHLIEYYFGTAVNVKHLWDYIKCNTMRILNYVWNTLNVVLFGECIYDLSFMLVL